ncbi:MULTISPECIES: DMT family transporter [unclassified Nocardioides]|uniref:DMT family transporter n=1 Tax=unclassified Nocardioides TaxID=2615069 RepID=UPI0036091D89
MRFLVPRGAPALSPARLSVITVIGVIVMSEPTSPRPAPVSSPSPSSAPSPSPASVPTLGVSHRPYTAVAALIAAAACWGFGTVTSKQVVDDVTPLTLLPAQLAVSCALLVAVALVRREPFAWTPSMRRLAALGALNPGAAYALGLVGLTSITASMYVLLWATEPVVILLLAALVLREHISPGLAVLVAVAVLGVLVVVYRPGAAGDTVGIVLTLVSVGFCAAYSVLTRRMLLDDSALAVVLAQQAVALAFAAVLATIVTLAGGTGWDLSGPNTSAWLGAAVSGILYYGLGFWFFVTALRRVPASYAGAFLPLIPVFGLAAGYLTGERLDARQWVGAVVIVTAVLAVALLPRRMGTARADATPTSGERCRG